MSGEVPPAACFAMGTVMREKVICIRPIGHSGAHRTGDGIEWAQVPRGRRSRHADTGPKLTPAQLRRKRCLIDVDAYVSRAIVRLGNHLLKHPDPGLRGHLEALKRWRRGYRAEVGR